MSKVKIFRYSLLAVLAALAIGLYVYAFINNNSQVLWLRWLVNVQVIFSSSLTIQLIWRYFSILDNERGEKEELGRRRFYATLCLASLQYAVSEFILLFVEAQLKQDGHIFLGIASVVITLIALSTIFLLRWFHIRVSRLEAKVDDQREELWQWEQKNQEQK